MASHGKSSTHSFQQIPKVKVPRSSFDHSHGHRQTFDAGFLVPIMCAEALPGDTMTLRATHFCRMATPIFPIMDNLHLDTFYFAVPYRLLWDKWQRFMGEQPNPGDSTDFLLPLITTGGFGEAAGGLADHLGIPPGTGLDYHALFHRAYNRIYNEWFRDENLQDAVPMHIDDGPDAGVDYVMMRRGKRHDYFSSALPFPQKGDAVNLPLGDSAPVIIDAGGIPTFDVDSEDGRTIQGLANALSITGTPIGPQQDIAWDDPNLTGTTDLTAAIGASINSFRVAFSIQELLERDARGGTRYVELLKSHFGVTSPDQRLQRPEYIGGGSIRINITPVAQTVDDVAGDRPVGNLGGFGLAAGSAGGFNKSFTEHCIVIGLGSVRADLTYDQGIARKFTRATRFDHYFPSLARLGEQTILNKEIFVKNDASDELVFGYQERHGEYRYTPSHNSGQMRTTHALTLAAWHLTQEFSDTPVLGADFIEDTPPMNRVLAVPTEPDFIMDTWFNFKCVRPMPTWGVPGLGSRF